MTIQVLNCRADGSQTLEAQEVPEDYLSSRELTEERETAESAKAP